MLYYIVFFILFLAFLSSLSKNKASKDMLFSIAVIALILFNGLKDPFLYPDNIAYYYYFNQHFDYAADGTLGWGYVTLNKIIYFFTSSFYVYCFIVALLITKSYTDTIRKYSPYKWLALLLFILVNYYSTFFLLRQYLVMPIFFFSFKYIIERKPIPFIICALLAFSIHTTALIIVPLYFLYGLKKTWYNMVVIIAGSVLVVLGLTIVGAQLTFLGDYYLQYFGLEQEEPAWQRAVMKVAIFGVFLYALWDHYYDEGINRILFYSFLMNVIICIGAMNIMGVFRLRDYYSIADFVGIPVILKYTRHYGSFKKIIIYSAVAIYIFLLILTFIRFVEGGNMLNSYQFFWNGTVHERESIQ